jgi:hypothetical protein
MATAGCRAIMNSSARSGRLTMRTSPIQPWKTWLIDRTPASLDRRGRAAAPQPPRHRIRGRPRGARRGPVDSRLLATLTALAAKQPLRILAFGDPSPGAGAAVPLRSAEIASAATAAHRGAALRAMLSFARTRRPPYRPAGPDRARRG